MAVSNLSEMTEIQLDREFDIVIFGATGYTGKYVVEELVKVTHNEPDHRDIKWAVAGRNTKKLQESLESCSKFTGVELPNVQCIEANVEEEESLLSMCKRAKLLINCVGPYRFYGEKLVKACLAARTHHLDISGEHQYLESMQLKYYEEAANHSIYIVGACGLDSIPCEMGVVYLKSKFEGTIHSVETYISFAGGSQGLGLNFTTYQSAIYVQAHASELRQIRRDINQKLFTKGLPKGKYPLKRRGPLFKTDVVNGWCLPFLGSDRAVTIRSQMYNYAVLDEKPVQIQTYFLVPTLQKVFTVLTAAAMFGSLCITSLGRKILEKHPRICSLGLFSKVGPSREQVQESSFALTLVAHGWNDKSPEANSETDVEHKERPNKKMVLKINGPEAAYLTTSKCIVNAAIVILKETEKLPGNGGVLTPGTAFGKTSLIDRLNNSGITFTLIDSGSTVL